MSNEQADTTNFREHRANERTFLAWIRTSISFIGLGFVIVKFSLFIKQLSILFEGRLPPTAKGYSPIIGVCMVGIGVLIAIFAYWEYRRVRKQLLVKSISSSSAALSSFTTLIVTVAGIFLILYLLSNI